MSDSRSAFNWRSAPSELAPNFRANSKGKTHSMTTSEAVTRHIAKHGRSPGTISGISSHQDRVIDAARARNVNRKAGA